MSGNVSALPGVRKACSLTMSARSLGGRCAPATFHENRLNSDWLNMILSPFENSVKHQENSIKQPSPNNKIREASTLFSCLRRSAWLRSDPRRVAGCICDGFGFFRLWFAACTFEDMASVVKWRNLNSW